MFITEIKDLTREEYELFRKLVYEKCGINLGTEKMQLVRARLGKRLRSGHFESYRAYYNHVAADKTGEELSGLIDSIATNTTHLFREIRHFELLKQLLQDWMRARRAGAGIRIWSAGCSSGEEPYSIAMVAQDVLSSQGGANPKILATDISTKVLAIARQGLFDQQRIGTVPDKYRKQYLKAVTVDGEPRMQVIRDVRRLITFSRFNLMTSDFPFKHGFDVIFCRNVMIYFDKPTQEALINRYAQHIRPGGYLMIGHSESLNNLNHPLTYIEPTVYRKP